MLLDELNLIAFRMAKILFSFGHSACIRVKPSVGYACPYLMGDFSGLSAPAKQGQDRKSVV